MPKQNKNYFKMILLYGVNLYHESSTIVRDTHAYFFWYKWNKFFYLFSLSQSCNEIYINYSLKELLCENVNTLYKIFTKELFRLRRYYTWTFLKIYPNLTNLLINCCKLKEVKTPYLELSQKLAHRGSNTVIGTP